jgi:hypothetical protein
MRVKERNPRVINGPEVHSTLYDKMVYYFFLKRCLENKGNLVNSLQTCINCDKESIPVCIIQKLHKHITS